MASTTSLGQGEEGGNDSNRPLTVVEIRQDPELKRLNKLLRETIQQSHDRLMQLYKENNITPVEVHEGLIVCNDDTIRQNH